MDTVSGDSESLDLLVGESPGIRRIRSLAERVGRTDATVLVTGESGTGKELVAHIIHERSHRNSGPFVAINCAGLSAELIQSELFGHCKGAFTGAHDTRRGAFRTAHGGTLFLDEVGDMPLKLQVSLLRVLETHTIVPLGSDAAVQVDVRVIAATNSNLEAFVAKGKFRPDLYYRLNVIRIHMPPLRTRPEDVPLLIEHFLRKHERYMKRPVGISQLALRKMMEFSWPGNVRELFSALSAACILSDGEIMSSDLPHAIQAPSSPHRSDASQAPTSSALTSAVSEGVAPLIGAPVQVTDGLSVLAQESTAEELRLLHAYVEHQGNLSRTVSKLGISRGTAFRRMAGIEEKLFWQLCRCDGNIEILAGIASVKFIDMLIAMRKRNRLLAIGKGISAHENQFLQRLASVGITKSQFEKAMFTLQDLNRVHISPLSRVGYRAEHLHPKSARR